MSYQKQSKALYSDSEDKVLPSTLRRGIFTIFVDYNIDKNSSSDTAGGHFQGEGVTASRLINEEKLLTSFYDDVPEPTSCAGYAEKQSRDKTGNVLTINVSLPLIHYKSSSVELQYHSMKVAVDYTEYLNPG